jgi:hypothetical protein
MTVEIDYALGLTGLAIVCRAYLADNGDASGLLITLTEDAVRKGYYRATGIALDPGTYWVQISANGSPFDSGWILADGSPTLLISTVSVANAISPSALLAIRASVTGVVTVNRGAMFSPGGGLQMSLTTGDDYLLSDSRQIDIDLDGTVLPDLTGATVSLRLSSGVRILVPGVVVVATGATRTVRFQPTSTDTTGLVPAVNGLFAVLIITATGHTITPGDGRGTLIVLPRVAP